MSRQNISWREPGFTLIELLIVTVVFGIVVTGALGFMTVQHKAFLKGSDQLMTLQNLRYAYQTMEIDLTTLGSNVPAGQPAMVLAGEDVIAFTGDYTSNLLNDVSAVYIDVDAPNGLVQAPRVKINIPNSSFAWPDTIYEAPGGTPSLAELRRGYSPVYPRYRPCVLINYFTYDLPNPEGPDPLSVHTEVGPAPWNPVHRLVRIGIQVPRGRLGLYAAGEQAAAVEVGASDAREPNATSRPCGDRRIRRRRRADTRSHVRCAQGDHPRGTFAVGSRGVHGRRRRPTAGIRCGTPPSHGRRKQPRDPSERRRRDSETIRLIEERRDEGTFLTVLGFGTGNLQDAKMEQIADHGNGNFAYIDSVHEAQKVLVKEFGGTLHTIAKDVKLQVEFNPAHVQAYRLVGYENRILAAEDFNDDRKDSGDLGLGHTVTALYEIIPTGVDTSTPIRGLDELRYQRTDERLSPRDGPEMLFVKLRYKDPNGSRSRLLSHAVRDVDVSPSSDFRFAASVAAFGMVLRDSEYRGSVDLPAVLRWARGSVGPDLEGYRREFVRMVEEAHHLADRG